MRFLLPLFGLGVLLSACSFTPQGDLGDQKIALVGPEDQAVSVDVEIADDAASRAKGLMEVESLAMNEGMLFMFEKSEPLTFWMKNTLIPLDIIFFDGIVCLINHTPRCFFYPESDVCTIFKCRSLIFAYEFEVKIFDLLGV